MIDLSQCDSGKGAAVMYDLLYNRPQKVIMLAGCSTVCTTVAEAAQLWNLVTVCYGASSPALSNRYAGQPASSVTSVSSLLRIRTRGSLEHAKEAYEQVRRAMFRNIS